MIVFFISPYNRIIDGPNNCFTIEPVSMTPPASHAAPVHQVSAVAVFLKYQYWPAIN